MEAELLPVFIRPLARVLGIVAPDGKAPLYLRLLLRTNRREVERAARRLVEFKLERVIFTHGHWFERNATNELRRSLAWLLGPGRDVQSGRVSSPRTSTIVAGVALLGVFAVLAARRKKQR